MFVFISTETEIPLKNLLEVNSSKESLSNKASYGNLRHCALSQLFKYASNGKIPNYANRNFLTQFSYYQVPTTKEPTTPLKKIRIKDGKELTNVLEAASMKHLVEDNDDVILHIHCDFINEFHFAEGEKFRKEATAAADNVVKTLKDWIKKASTFVSNHADKLAVHDYVVVPNDEPRNKSKRDSGERKEEHSPFEWAARFIEVLLSPEERGNPNNLSSWTTIPKNQNQKVDTTDSIVDQSVVDQYDEILDNLTDSVGKGLQSASKFIFGIVKDYGEMAEKIQRSHNSNYDDVLSLSQSPSLAESASISSDSSSSTKLRSGSSELGDDEVVEQGVEIVFDPFSKEGDNGDSEEWKIFFGDAFKGGAVDDVDAVLINHVCNEEIVSISSSEQDDMSSFEELSDHKEENDNASWAMLSDDE